VQKPTPGKTQRGLCTQSAASKRSEVTQGKPIACVAGHYSRENPTWLAYAAMAIVFCLKTDIDVVTLTF